MVHTNPTQLNMWNPLFPTLNTNTDICGRLPINKDTTTTTDIDASSATISASLHQNTATNTNIDDASSTISVRLHQTYHNKIRRMRTRHGACRGYGTLCREGSQGRMAAVMQHVRDKNTGACTPSEGKEKSNMTIFGLARCTVCMHQRHCVHPRHAPSSLLVMCSTFVLECCLPCCFCRVCSSLGPVVCVHSSSFHPSYEASRPSLLSDSTPTTVYGPIFSARCRAPIDVQPHLGLSQGTYHPSLAVLASDFPGEPGSPATDNFSYSTRTRHCEYPSYIFAPPP